MRKIKIKKQNGATRKKRISIRRKRMESPDEIIYPYNVEEFPLGFPMRFLFKIQKRVS